MITLLEDKRAQLLSRAKQGDEYVPWNQHKGKNRYERRLHSKVASSVKQFNNMDMNKFFKDDIVDVIVEVKGETDTYNVRMSFYGTLDELHNFLSQGKELDRKIIMKSLSRAFSRDDVYIRCDCPDFCLYPDTNIKLLSGESISVKEMCNRFNNGEKLWVYSTDDNGDFVPGEVENVWITKYTKTFIEVTLDNNEKILTTPNHLYRLRDGSYKEADKLSINDSLMPLYFSYHNGYECVKKNSEIYPTIFESVYKKVANLLLKEDFEKAKQRTGENHTAIHHSNFNKLDNRPENLKIMGKDEHFNYHSTHVKESGVLNKWLKAGKEYWSKQESRDKQAKVMSKVISNYYANRTPEEIERDSKNRSETSKNAWKKGCFNTEKFKLACKKRGEFLHTPEIEVKSANGYRNYVNNLSEEEFQIRFNSEKQSKIAKEAWAKGCYNTEKFKVARKNAFQYERTEQTERKRNITKIGNVIQKIINDGKIPSPDTYEEYKTNGYPNFTKVFSNWDDVSGYYGLNHKVKSIKTIILDNEVPVYDIQVKDYNNFLVDAGVILHNCYRHAYWATKNNIIIGDPETRPSDETNPNDTKGPGCKHVTLALSDSSWLIRVASVILNYVHYMEDHQERMYQKFIYPAIYQEPWSDESQLDITDIDGTDELESDEDTIRSSNERARERGRFKQGNEYRFRKELNKDGEQQSFDLDSLG